MVRTKSSVVAAAAGALVAVLTACSPLAAAATFKPYVSATGGDVLAGASIATNPGDPCGVPIGSAGIVSWNSDGNPDFAGAGGQYAAFARSYIQDFVTGQGNYATGGQGYGQMPSGQETSELAFSNVPYTNNGITSVTKNKGLFGGLFGAAPATCVDYWSSAQVSMGSFTPFSGGSVSPLNSKSFRATGNVTISGGQIDPGKQVSIYVDGNVAITGNITYPAVDYGGRTNIPIFRLIVHGVIYIDKSVTQLDGLYAAIPDTGAGDVDSSANTFNQPQAGTISTCSQAAAPFYASYDPTQIAGNSMDTACTGKLTFNGSVVAQQIWLLRGSSSTAAGEIFNYTPEIWLAPSAPDGVPGAGGDYQSIVGLPPIL